MALARECERNPLVFLQGESGAGKSALVLGGLLPQYQATRAGNEAARLLPIRIDASPLAWDKGLRIELARALRDVSADEQARLGATAPLGSGDPFASPGRQPTDDGSIMRVYIPDGEPRLAPERQPSRWSQNSCDGAGLAKATTLIVREGC